MAMNANNPMTPGVYTVEKNAFPPSVGEVPTAIPAFIGYTEKAISNGKSLQMVPVLISSLSEYTSLFGGAPETQWPIYNVPKQANGLPPKPASYDLTISGKYYKVGDPTHQYFLLYNSVRLFFQNGGGQCYIVSVNEYLSLQLVSPPSGSHGDPVPEDLPTTPQKKDLTKGLAALTNIPFPKPTMILIPDALVLSEEDCISIQQDMLAQCGTLRDRVSLLDIYAGYKAPVPGGANPVESFRNGIGINDLDYGIAYYPWLECDIVSPQEITYANIDQTTQTPNQAEKMASLFPGQPAIPYLKEITQDFETVQENVMVPKLVPAQKQGKHNTSGGHTPAPPSYPSWKAAFNGSPSTKSEDILNQQVLTLISMYYLLDQLSQGKFPTSYPAPKGQTNLTIQNEQLMGAIGLMVASTGTLAEAMIALEPFISFYKVDLSGSNAPTTPNKDMESISAQFNTLSIQPKVPFPSTITDPYYSMDPQPTTNQQFTIANSLLKNTFNLLNNAINSVITSAQNILSQNNSSLEKSSQDYMHLMQAIAKKANILPPSPAMAGVITTVDNTLGVWNAPANINIDSVVAPTIHINDDQQASLNEDVLAGKSINAIRSFYGRGPAIIWGARTLDGNSNDWRYINVRRTLIMIEQSVKNAAEGMVFKPNDEVTWKSVEGMISGFLRGLWANGALQGTTAKDAFSVLVGLGKTMTPQDILSGIMRVSVKVAVVHPAEFIIITYEQEMAKSG